jgi:FkbM family methyltransferase
MSPWWLEYAAMSVFAKLAGMLPWGLGQFRLAHRYVACRRWPEGSIVIQKMRSGAKLSLDLGDRAQAIAFLVRDYGPQHTRYIASRLPTNGTLFDVGAHIGLISFAMAVKRPDITLHAFEPNAVNARAWRRNQQLNVAVSARITEAGVSDRDGQMKFGLVGDAASGQLGRDDGILVPVIALDSYCAQHGIERIDVLKIDVEGHEEAVLRGAERLLSVGAIKTVVCEMNISDPQAIIQILRSHGFRPKEIPEIGVRGSLGGLITKRAGGDLAFER